jgi:branched-chain amino acid transport system substrate-binding protein
VPYYGPSVKWFTDTYKTTYHQEPDYQAAGGFASALVIQKAIEETGTLDSNKVKQVLDRMNIMKESTKKLKACQAESNRW